MPTTSLHRSSRRRAQRASDADRAKVAKRLRRAADQGRLHLDEFDERLGLVLSARTYRELDVVVADLPRGRALITRPAVGAAVWRRLRLVRRFGAAAVVIRPRRAVVVGALATAAVAVPVAATNALSFGSSGAGGMCPHDVRSSTDPHCWWFTNPKSVLIHGQKLPSYEVPSHR